MNIISGYLKDYPMRNIQEIDQPHTVYVIKNPLNNQYKIGISGNLSARIANIDNQSGIHHHIIFFAEMEIGYDEPAKQVETYLHKYFKEIRGIGEWFSLGYCQILEIEALIKHIGCESSNDLKQKSIKKLF